MKKVLIKISGEFFQNKNQPIVFNQVMKVALEIKGLVERKVKVAVVVGAGNILRGNRIKSDLDRSLVDYAGMCAALTNGLVLQAALDSLKVKTVLDSTLNVSQVGRYHRPQRARQDFESGKVLILGGAGLPYFSTDTAAVVFALEIGAEILLKATKVKGVYSSDPVKNKKAKFFDNLTFSRVLEDDLQVMDQTAFALARDNALPVRVFKWQQGVLLKIIRGEKIGTLVS